MKNKTIFIILGLSLFVLLVVFLREPTELSKEAAKRSNVSENGTIAISIDEKQKVALNNVNKSNIEADTAPNESDTEENTVGLRANLNYEDEWCSTLQLNEKDKQFALDEDDRWRLESGNVSFGRLKQLYGRDENNNSLGITYQNMSDEDLLLSAESGDDLARQVILSRFSIDEDTRDKIAKGLIIEGKTGRAIHHFVIKNTVQFTYALENQQPLEVKKNHLLNAIVYANYGLERYDATGIEILVSSLKRADKEFDVSSFLTDSDLLKIKEKTKKLKKSIRSARFSRNIPRNVNDDIPKAAKGLFQTHIAIMYKDNEHHLKQFINLNLSQSSALKKNKCINKLIQLNLV